MAGRGLAEALPQTARCRLYLEPDLIAHPLRFVKLVVSQTFSEYDPYVLTSDSIREPPPTLWGTLRMIGPGIVLAGTIVGSGELLLTTGLGAKTGYAFLWLILLSCVIKVFVQIELGRYAIASAKPTLAALHQVPLPRRRTNFLVWWWLCMMLMTIFQLGAMTGTVGQSLHLTFPSVTPAVADKATSGWLHNQLIGRPELLWAFLTFFATLLLLWSGTYRRIERVTTAIVIAVTVLTVAAAIALSNTNFPIRWGEVVSGLSPTNLSLADTSALATAFGVFGITGVGATELFYYPYWCLEKGYAKYVGPHDGTDAWYRRAKGWIRVMYFDAWISMVVFTVSTVAFYFMGASVLNPQGLNPSGTDMIQTLSRMFVDSFGAWTRVLFLIGASAVLFKTLYLSCAANARMLTDFLGLTNIVSSRNSQQRSVMIQRFSLLFPLVALTLFLIVKNPKLMVVIGGCAQAATLPMIAGSALYFRYRQLDARLKPSMAWDLILWIAVALITLVAIYSLSQSGVDLYATLKTLLESSSKG